NWYDVPSGGTVLGIGTTFNTPVISSTTTFYAEAGFGCNSSRVSVVAEIKPVPADPVANDVLNCGPGSIQLTATSPEQIYWYDAPTGGNLLATGTSFTTPNITVATPYYVEAGDVCRSNRVEVDAIVLAISEITTIFEDSVCGSGVMSLQAVSNDPITWYDAIGGNIVGTGSIFTTPSLNSTATYYAVAGTVCPGTPVAISAIVHPLPVVELGGDTLFEEIGNVAQLDAGPGFVSYNWSTSETTQTISMTTDGYYSVTVTDGNGCQASDQIFVSFFVGIGDVENGSNVSIFPNPAHDEATIEISNLRESKAVLQILTTDGRLVFDKVIHPSGSICREKLHLADYAAGVYFVKVIAGEKTKMLRVVISN
ncbi:MAG: T9SS type A sorting domain-containing protein, partial [Bacteroidia bacterium]